ncbi:syntaxin-18 [Galendromus occidentalis]|uniref:Syntaxin-18 n=1 Tax=Galendromus occidentalis TaxID=34638 RepID=A0AAJ6QUZ3_9ACAR|nr:syntaxin-18 [Galendromus occidentalis]
MDLTSNFTSLVKTLRSRSKALGDVDEPRSPRTQKEKSRFNSKAKDVVNSISQMKEFFLEHREDYIDRNFLIFNGSKMSDLEREEIDSEAHKFIAKCKQVIGNLRKEINICASSPQQKAHLTAVILMIEEYLRLVGRIWSSQRALRMRQAERMRAFGSLTGGQTVRETPGGVIESTESTALDEDESFEKASGKRCILENAMSKRSLPFHEDSHPEEFKSVEITQADVLALEEENTRLYDELNSMAEQVKLIGGRVEEISELQKQFVNKVIEQDEEVQRIALNTIHATESVKDGNEQIRQAMQNSAGMRVSILFVLIVLSLSLLFLDWYNP